MKLDMTSMPDLPCEPIKPYCVASGRKRPSYVRRNLNQEVHASPESRLDEPYSPGRSAAMRKHFILDGKGNYLHKANATDASAPCVSSPPIQAAKKKMRSAVAAASLLGVRAGTQDSEALCRGDFKGANIWDYIRATSPDAALNRRRPSSPPRPLSARHNMTHKSACVAGGNIRPSSVVRNLRCFRKTDLDDNHAHDPNSHDCSRPSSPMGSVDFDIHPYQITVASSEEQHVDYGVSLPPIADCGKLIPPNLKVLGDVLGDVHRSRRPSMDSVSTAPSESDIGLCRTF